MVDEMYYVDNSEFKIVRSIRYANGTEFQKC